MAKPIKETPVLYGRDAQRFIKENRNVAKVSTEERKTIRENYEALKRIKSF